MSMSQTILVFVQSILAAAALLLFYFEPDLLASG